MLHRPDKFPAGPELKPKPSILNSLIHTRVHFYVAMIIQEREVKTTAYKNTNTCDKLVSDFPSPSLIYLKSKYGLTFVTRACTVRKNQLLSLLLQSDFTSLAPSVLIGSFFSCAILMQCSCKVDLLWSLIPSDLKVVHSVMYNDHRCCSPMACS